MSDSLQPLSIEFSRPESRRVSISFPGISSFPEVKLASLVSALARGLLPLSPGVLYNLCSFIQTVYAVIFHLLPMCWPKCGFASPEAPSQTFISYL